MQRNHRAADQIHVRIGILLREPADDRRRFGFRLLIRDTGLQSSDHAEKMRAPSVQHLHSEILERQRVIDVLVFNGELPARGHHANDRVRA